MKFNLSTKIERAEVYLTLREVEVIIKESVMKRLPKTLDGFQSAAVELLDEGGARVVLERYDHSAIGEKVDA